MNDATNRSKGQGSPCAIDMARRRDWYEIVLSYDKAYEDGEAVWELLQVGACVLLECPQRWYAGIVKSRSSMTVVLNPVSAIHTISDYSRFVSGTIPGGTEVSPLPGDKEISLAAIETAGVLPAEFITQLQRRSHEEVS